MRWHVGISTTSWAPSPPRPALALGDGHPPASPRSHEDCKATRTWTFLDAPEKRKAHGDRQISAGCGSRFARFSCCLSRENAPFPLSPSVERYPRFSLSTSVKNNCCNGFCLTMAIGRSLCAEQSLKIDRFLRYCPTFRLHCGVWVVDWLSRQGYKGFVIMVPLIMGRGKLPKTPPVLH